MKISKKNLIRQIWMMPGQFQAGKKQMFIIISLLEDIRYLIILVISDIIQILPWYRDTVSIICQVLQSGGFGITLRLKLAVQFMADSGYLKHAQHIRWLMASILEIFSLNYYLPQIKSLIPLFYSIEGKPGMELN